MRIARAPRSGRKRWKCWLWRLGNQNRRNERINQRLWTSGGISLARRKSFFHVRKPSLKGSIAARTSIKRMLRAKTRAPKGWGWLTNPKKAAYNRAYNRRTISLASLFARLFR